MQPINVVATVKLHSHFIIEQSQLISLGVKDRDIHSAFPTSFLRHIFAAQLLWSSYPLNAITELHQKLIKLREDYGLSLLLLYVIHVANSHS